MNCRDIETLILSERDGALSQEQGAVVAGHVAACPACRQFRLQLTAALDAYRTEAATIPVPDADAAWRDLGVNLAPLAASAHKRSLAPVFWFGAPLAAAAAFALAWLARPRAADLPIENVASADFVEAGDANASTMVYVDKDSGWLVVWAADETDDARQG